MEWRVPLFDPDIDEPEIQAVTAVLRSKWLTMGDRTTEFEARFAELCGVRHAIAVNSCTAALHIALVSAGVRPGDEVIVPALTFVATANAARYCAARPVFADVASYDEWNVSRETIEPLLTSKTRAMVVMHYAGYPCRMREITALAKEHGLAVVEDAAHAPGGKLEDRSMGAWGDAGCFSFFSNKNMTTAEGGMLTTNQDAVAERARRLRSHGMTTLTLDRHKGLAFSYDVVDLGYNYRMTELNATLGLCQLQRLEAGNRARAERVRWYRERLSSIDGLAVPFTTPAGQPTHHIMPVLLPKDVDRTEVMRAMRYEAIQTSIHYRPVDTFTAFAESDVKTRRNLERTHDIGKRALTLPLYPSITAAQVDAVCDALARALRNARRSN